MSRTIGQTGVSAEDLQLYFDGELSGSEARELAAQIEAHPELKAELDQLSTLHGLVSEGMLRKSAEVPQARFEQIWEEIDRSLDRDERAQATPGAASIWSRIWTMLAPVRIPAVAAAGAAALAVVVMATIDDSQPGSEANNPGAVASVDQAPEPKEPSADDAASTPSRPMPAQPDRIAAVPEQEPSVEFPAPTPAEAEIHTVEFNGRAGRISRTGTVTVLFVEEDDEPQDSERSL